MDYLTFIQLNERLDELKALLQETNSKLENLEKPRQKPKNSLYDRESD